MHLRRVGLTLLIGVLSAVGLVVVAPPSPVAAVNAYLCTGYDACASAGYSHAGYKTAGSKMYWRMYGGHNCTNYVAYRLVQSGLPNTRPWEGSGNATNWGAAMSDITDQTPRVGAVAWWRANTPGAGSSGHVAYVERVVSATEIVISEDMWSGDFHWRRITKDSGRWPAGFIHFNDVPLTASEKPSVVGTPVVGKTVSADLGTWPSGARLSLRWYADGKALSGATSKTLAITPALLSKRLKVRVAASKTGYASGASTSTSSSATAPGTLDVQAKPAVQGTTRVGQTLSLAAASWSPSPEQVDVQWLADGQPIDGATAPTLTLPPDLVGSQISARQTATEYGYRTSTLTAPTSTAVAPGLIEVTKPFAISGTARVGRTLTVGGGATTPSDATRRYAWLRDGQLISGANEATYAVASSDAGHVISARVMLARAGYSDKWAKAATNGPVTTTPTVSVSTATSKGGALIVTLRVTARGVSSVTGAVTATVDSVVAKGDLVDGRLRLVMRGIPAGRRVLDLVYDGTDVVEAAHVRMAVTIPRT